MIAFDSAFVGFGFLGLFGGCAFGLYLGWVVLIWLIWVGFILCMRFGLNLVGVLGCLFCLIAAFV